MSAPEHSAEQGLLAQAVSAHVTSVSVMGGWSRRNGKESAHRYGWTCSCGAHSRDQFQNDLTLAEADVERFQHVAEGLAPLLANLLAQARADVLREHADREVERGGHGQSLVERLLEHAHEHDGHLGQEADRG